MVIKVKHGTAYLNRIHGHGWYLASVVVEEGHRRQGVGSQLMQRVLHKIRERPIYLFASSELGTDVKVLKKFYRKFGFRPVSRAEARQLGLFPYNVNMALD